MMAAHYINKEQSDMRGIKHGCYAGVYHGVRLQLG
jgi:hypothetical protein